MTTTETIRLIQRLQAMAANPVNILDPQRRQTARRYAYLMARFASKEVAANRKNEMAKLLLLEAVNTMHTMDMAPVDQHSTITIIAGHVG